MFRRFLALLVMCVVLLSGCSVSAPFQWQDETVDLVWPKSPEPARIRYMRSLTGPGDFKQNKDSSKMFKWWFGENQDDIYLYNPFAVAVGNAGQVWIADSGTRSVFLVDTGNREVKDFPLIGDQPFVSPSGIAVDNERGRVYVSDAAYNRIFILNLNGSLLSTLAPEGGFQRPAGLALGSNGQLLVADAGAGKVFLFDPDGSVAKHISSKTRDDGRFLRPLSVAFGPNDEVLVLDAFSFHVEVQSSQGELLGTIGQLGDAAGYLARPRGLAVDSEGHVFISDAAFDNIQVFDMAGNLLTFWGGAGGDAGKFNLPAGVFIDKQGRFFVADSYNHRVQVYQLLQ